MRVQPACPRSRSPQRNGGSGHPSPPNLAFDGAVRPGKGHLGGGVPASGVQRPRGERLLFLRRRFGQRRNVGESPHGATGDTRNLAKSSTDPGTWVFPCDEAGLAGMWTVHVGDACDVGRGIASVHVVCMR